MRELDNQDVRSLAKNLDLMASQVVEGFIVGLHKSPFHGFSVEFAEHRLYNQGESTRSIDWKVYGRTDKMFTKKFEEETNLRCQVVLDASSTMFYPWDAKNPELHKYSTKYWFSAQAAAVLFNIMRKQRDAFGLSLFDTDLRVSTGNKSSTMHYRLLLNYLNEFNDKRALGRSTDLAKSLHLIADKTHRRSMVVIFTDVIEAAGHSEELFSALQHLRYNKHEVILFHVTDKRHELDFDFENRPYIFEDMETGEQLRLMPNQVKEFYTKQVGTFMDELRMKCLQFRIDFVEADITEGFQKVLERWMVKRKKMM